jgi:GxxExxY protein
MNDYEFLAKNIFESSLEVHKIMGPGLLESIYEFCLAKELRIRGISVKTQVPIPLFYKGHEIDKDFRIDILIEDKIIVEVKAVESILPVHQAQITSYLKLYDSRMGFLINFNTSLIKDGFKRFVNNY